MKHGGKITFDALDQGLNELGASHHVFIDACGAEEKFEYLSDQGLHYNNLSAAPGASGESKVPQNAANALGINVPKDAWIEKK